MKLHYILSLAALIPAFLSLQGAVTLPAVFSDHAVLAKKSSVPVWGKADPNEKIVVYFNGQTHSTTADQSGNFRITLDLSKSPAGPFELRINDKVIKDILVGEVYLASGQSNMAFRLPRCENIEDAMKTPNNQIRFFNVERNFALKPQHDLSGKWLVFSPENTPHFSGVAYFFAAELQRSLKVPVGILQSSVGGSFIEAWMDEATLKNFPNARSKGQENLEKHKSYPIKYKKFLRANAAWEKKYGKADIPQHLPPANAKWLPAGQGKLTGNGVIWLKNTFTLSENAAANGFGISFEKIFQPTSVWIDGKKVGERIDKAWELASYSIRLKGGKYAPGEHTVMIRIHASRPHAIFRTPQINKVRMNSGWEMYREKTFARASKIERKECPPTPGQPINPLRRLNSALYNAMIHPLVPYRLSGVIWYQGESNAANSWEYGQLFPAMIKDWRKKFDDPNLPFFFCLVAPYRAKNSNPAEFGWGDLRSAQLKALALPHTGMAVLFDAGETEDIHPLDKTTPGKRLAAQALVKVYGKNIPCESPQATHAVKSGKDVKIFFAHTYNGLKATEVPAFQHMRKTAKKTAPLVRTSPDAQLEGFILCDADGKWYWADKAEITGSDHVTVSAAAVPNPVKVRYCWSNNPTCNLFNSAGFPAAPFELLLQ